VEKFHIIQVKLFYLLKKIVAKKIKFAILQQVIE